MTRPVMDRRALVTGCLYAALIETLCAFIVLCLIVMAHGGHR